MGVVLVLAGSFALAFVVATIGTSLKLRSEHEALKRRVDAIEAGRETKPHGGV